MSSSFSFTGWRDSIQGHLQVMLGLKVGKLGSFGQGWDPLSFH